MVIIRTKKLVKKQITPVWEGPESTGRNGGVTQSLLNRFILCRERFRLLVIDGLQSADSFNHRLEYGQMWHCCEEWFAQNKSWQDALRNYSVGLCQRYQTQQEQVQHWYNVCKTQFPLYVQYWAKHKDVVQRTPLLQEVSFNVPYELPSKRVVRLRGKWDSVDLIGKGKSAGIYLQENKTKADINEEQIKRQMQFDLQTMLYLVALQTELKQELRDGFPKGNLAGVRYNVIRRPLSGGRGSIVRHKAKGSTPEETLEHYYGRLRDIIEESPQEFFMRWKVEVTQQDITRFRRECLDPLLESLCDWWEFISTHLDDPFDPASHGIHSRTPFGLYNVLAESGSTEVDEYLATGSTVGLQKAVTLFNELE
jgi:hypothetical protein